MERKYLSPDGLSIFYETGPVDEYGKVVTRTKQTHPYSYDGFVTWRGGDNSEITGTVYSDRLLQWAHEKCRSLMMKHFGGDGDYYYNRTPKQIQEFLRDYMDAPQLKLILVMEYCNVSSGYPVWRFDYNTPKRTN